MIPRLKICAKLQISSLFSILAFSILLVLPTASMAETPSLAAYLRDRNEASGRNWETALTLDTLTNFSDSCDAVFETQGDKGLIERIVLGKAVNEALDESLSLLIVMRAITQISQSAKLYERLTPTIDQIGGLYYVDFRTFQETIKSSDCYDLNENIDGKPEELYIGMSQSLFTLVELYTEAYNLENWRLLVSTNVPLIENLEVVSDEAALKRSSGRVLLHVGTIFRQEYFASLVRNLVNSDIRPELYSKEGSDALKIYFYANELPDSYAASQIVAAKQIIVDLLELYEDEIKEIENSTK